MVPVLVQRALGAEDAPEFGRMLHAYKQIRCQNGRNATTCRYDRLDSVP
jgi:hypothetical protein